MIELLINKRTRLPIAAKPAGSNWGYREIDSPGLCVVQIPRDDLTPALLARIDARRVVANPFAEHAVDPVIERPVMVRQSAFKLRSADVRRGARVRMTDMETDAGP